MKEIRLHGRGGQGAAIAAEMLAAALVKEGKYAVAFPMFGFERRGAPVTAFVRFDDKPVRQRTQVYEPDCLIVTDQSFRKSKDIFLGLRPGGTLVVNVQHQPQETLHPNLRIIGAVDATGIGLQEIGKPITNTCILGAFASTTQWLKLESLQACFQDYFSGKLLQDNLRCAERGYRETAVLEFKEAVDALEK
ncbi:MAG: 2-oxoacid:acceptor oxidoreductase family protein [Dehalococcoidia bacterium]|nr:2-oxoacid:acceptor oxidoreductase family protein [Dehalococcoidia bacterium]